MKFEKLGRRNPWRPTWREDRKATPGWKLGIA